MFTRLPSLGWNVNTDLVLITSLLSHHSGQLPNPRLALKSRHTRRQLQEQIGLITLSGKLRILQFIRINLVREIVADAVIGIISQDHNTTILVLHQLLGVLVPNIGNLKLATISLLDETLAFVCDLFKRVHKALDEVNTIVVINHNYECCMRTEITMNEFVTLPIFFQKNHFFHFSPSLD